MATKTATGASAKQIRFISDLLVERAGDYPTQVDSMRAVVQHLVAANCFTKRAASGLIDALLNVMPVEGD